MKLIDGKKIAEEITKQVRKDIVDLGSTPGLAVFLVGDDPASHLYVKLKEKACQKVGINFYKYLCEGDMGQADVIEALDFVNKDDSIDAILIQLPLPAGFDQEEIIKRIDPKKDVDGFHPDTLKAFMEGKSNFIPGLSSGIIGLIESTKEQLDGKHAVIVAKSETFSQPLIKLLEDKGVTVETTHPDDLDLADKTIEADILIVAVGRPGFITGDMVKDGSIIIDVGTTMIDGKYHGDVDFESVDEIAGYITPVPGGVGPVTVAMLLENVVKLAKAQN